jgi:ketosteroid isomerase-like protein
MSSTYMSNTRSMIEASNEKFSAFTAKGDAVGIASLYTANARLLPPDTEIVEGRQAIQSFWQAFLDSGVTDATLTTRDVEEGGNMAREIGTFTGQVQQGTETVTVRGKYVVIWKQEDGAWKMDVDIWNDTPQP